MKSRTYLIEIIRFILITLIILTCGSQIHSNILYVPENYETIQSAIDASQGGDTVLIAQGLYEEELTIEGHGIRLASGFLLENDTSIIDSTILSGDSLFRQLYVNSIDNDTLKIIGLSFINGTSADTGMAVKVINSIVEINNCKFIGNFSNSDGGALYAYLSSILLSDNIFRHNSANRRAAARIDSCHGLIKNNIIEYNTSNDWAGGFSVIGSNINIENNIFNSNYSSYAAGGLQYLRSSGIISDNIFENNYSGVSGGLHATSGSYLLLENNIFRFNNSEAVAGGAVIACDTAIIRDNLFEYNYSIDNDDILGTGGALHISSRTGYIEIYRNSFIGNQAQSSGGAITTFDTLYLHDNIFVDNKSLTGSAIFALGGTDPYVEAHSNLFLNNQLAFGGIRDYYGAIDQGNNANFNFYDNDFINNPILAANAEFNGIMQAANNFWGSPDGPQHALDNPGGAGDSVANSVDILPFSTERHTPWEAPALFNLVSPDDDSISFLSSMTFTWNSSTDPNDDTVRYTLEIALNDTFSEAVRYPSGTDTFFHIDGLESNTYWWRVYAEDQIWMRTYSRRTRTFNVILDDGHAPMTFNLGEPENEVLIEEAPILFTWFPSRDSTSGDIIDYTLELSQDEDFEQVESFPADGDTFTWVPEINGNLNYWRVYASDVHEHITYSRESRSFQYTGVEDSDLTGIPKTWVLNAVYPNPFNPVVKIVVGVPVRSNLKAEVFDLLGRRVAVLKDDKLQPGYHKMYWIAKGSTGIYFLRIESETGWRATRKLLYIK
ncbi:T9SS type A sorting domain-containing protein [Calditrichota bacterium]